ncbi:MAG: aminoglycoside N3'-acetyltransferase [Cognaticolwellia sp.]|jgi:aminoglycoside 3-N-acetyltransferase
MKKKITKESIIESLIDLGIKKGDILFLSADLMRIGYFNKNIDTTLKDWVEILQSVVGKDGTLIIPSNTTSFSRFKKSKDIVFTPDSAPNSGSLSTAFYLYADVIRSTHPTNSCFGIGPKAEFILDGHDEKSLSYSIYGKIIELGGKNLMLGTVEDNRNSPMPFHFCQEVLGHTRSHPLANLQQTYFINSKNNKTLFTRKDVGGCTGGAINTFGEHIAQKAIKFGPIGKSLSALVDTKKSSVVLMNIFNERPYLIKCNNKDCLSCYGRYIYNGFGVIKFYSKYIPQLVYKILTIIKRKVFTIIKKNKKT